MKYGSLLALVLLAACGAEAPPRALDASAAGLTISGEARIGVVAKL